MPVQTSDAVLDEGPHSQQLSPEDRSQHWHDQQAFGLFGKAGDVDFFLCQGFYHVGGALWGQAEGGSTCLVQTNLLLTDGTQREMRDGPQVSTRLDPLAGHPLVLETDAESCTWAAGGRRVVRRGGTWTISGEHAGVGMDIEVTALGEAEHYKGPWSNVEKVGIAGNSVLGRATGTFTHQGVEHTITEGYAVRERALFGNGWDIVSNLDRTTRRNYFWTWVFSDELSVFLYEQSGSDGAAASVHFADGSVSRFTEAQTRADITGHWTDPVVRSTTATALEIVMESEEGTLRVAVQTSARSLFGFHPRNGYTVHSGALGRATGSFVRPDGTVVSLDGATSYVEQGYAVVLPAV